MSNDNSFHVLRVKIWLEFTDTNPPEREWRGEIRQLESGEVAYFQHLEGFAEGVRKLGIVEDDEH